MSGKTAGIIIVGDEILKGQVRDTNSHFMCKRLRALGTKVEKMSVVGDNIDDIARTVREFSERFDIVLTSGGIGPTHDDVTYKGIAAGFNEDIVCNDTIEAFWNQQLFNNCSQSSRAMAMVPKSAKLIWTNTGSVIPKNKDDIEMKVDIFPVVNVRNVFVLPGIPQYLEALFSSMEKDHFQSQGCSFYTGKIYLGVYEELILNALNKTVAEMKHCVFGSYPVVGNPCYKTIITVEAQSVDQVKAAEDFFKSLVPSEWLTPSTDDMSNPVYKFLHTTADPRLAATLSKSIKLVEEAFEQYAPSNLMVSFNGGKDCTVLLHIILAVRDHKSVAEPLQAVYFSPINPFPDVEQFINSTVSKYHVQLTTLPGPIKSNLAVLVEQKPELKAIFLGTRRTDPFSQDLKHYQMTDPDWTQIMRINPLLDWSYQDIWTFLRGISAPYCALYDQGYTSLGNKDNTRPNPSLLKTNPDGSQSYLPAWMLTDDTRERNGRL